jgi:hypothetical protein
VVANQGNQRGRLVLEALAWLAADRGADSDNPRAREKCRMRYGSSIEVDDGDGGGGGSGRAAVGQRGTPALVRVAVAVGGSG